MIGLYTPLFQEKLYLVVLKPLYILLEIDEEKERTHLEERNSEAFGIITIQS